MNGTSGFQQGGLLPPDYYRIGLASCTSNGINSEQVSGIFFRNYPVLRSRNLPTFKAGGGQW
jgi:hypothetical protein